MSASNYVFELLVIDENGKSEITAEKKFLQAIDFSEKVWEDSNIVKNEIIDEKLKIRLKVKAADLAGSLAEMEYSSVFFVTVKGESFSSMEAFRKRLLVHLRKLGFMHTRILKDDISTELAISIYPLINRVENHLRSFLVKFFIQKVGINWWEVTAPKTVLDKVKSRTGNEPVFSSYIDSDVTLCDFDDLGELIYKQTTGFNSPDKIVDKIMNTNSPEELDKLKSELQGNYTKYFKESFQDKLFDKKWKQLFAVRNKVAHNNLMTAEDKQIAEENTEYVEKVIGDAEKLIKDFTFTMEDKQAFFDASVSRLSDVDSEPNQQDRDDLKVIGKIDLKGMDSGHQTDLDSYFKVIDEDTLIEQIQYFHRISGNVSVKGVAETLMKKGYDKRLVYSLTDLLVGRGVLEYYTYQNEVGFETRGVKVIVDSRD